jgi:hypothetical protein
MSNTASHRASRVLQQIEAKKSAPEEYARVAAEAASKLKAVEAGLKAHALKQAKKPQSFGFVGDVVRVNELLDELLAALKG